MTRIYYSAETGEIRFVVDLAPGVREPPGDYIEVEEAPADLHLWRVEDCALVRLPNADAIALQEAREVAVLSKSAFLVACKGAELLSAADAKLASKGELPTAYAAAIAGWPAEVVDDLEIMWPSITEIDRMHPLILAVAAEMGIPDTTLDALFGIGAP